MQNLYLLRIYCVNGNTLTLLFLRVCIFHIYYHHRNKNYWLLSSSSVLVISHHSYSKLIINSPLSCYCLDFIGWLSPAVPEHHARVHILQSVKYAQHLKTQIVTASLTPAAARYGLLMLLTVMLYCIHSRPFWVCKRCTYLLLYTLCIPWQRVYKSKYVHLLHTLARGHNVFVLSNSRDHRFSHPSPTFKYERKNFLLPSILCLFPSIN